MAEGKLQREVRRGGRCESAEARGLLFKRGGGAGRPRWVHSAISRLIGGLASAVYVQRT